MLLSQGLAVTVGGTTSLGPGDWVLAWWLQGIYGLDELVPKKKKKWTGTWDMLNISDGGIAHVGILQWSLGAHSLYCLRAPREA